MKLLILIIILHWKFKASNNLLLNKLLLPNHIYANYTTYFADLFQEYEHYHRLYHMETKSRDVFDDVVTLLRKSYVRKTFSVYNYDVMEVPKQFVRPNAARILHVIYTRNPSHWGIFTQPYKISYRDVTIFVTDNSKDSKLMYQNTELAKLSGKILLIEIANSTSNGILLYQICHFCGNMSKTLIPILGKPSRQTLYPFNYKNLNQHELKLAFVPNYPFVFCNAFVRETYHNITFDVCTDIGGIESHMVKAISEKMNFQFKAYTLQWSNASFLAMLQSVGEGNFDLAFGSISITLERRNIIQYTMSYNVEEFNLLYKVSLSFYEELKKFFDPFSDTTLWILFLTAQFLLVVLLLGIQKLDRRLKRRKSLVECFWLLLQIQLEQSIPSRSSPATPRPSDPAARSSLQTLTRYSSALLLLWCLTCLVLCSAYKGITLSTTLRPPKTEPQGILELLERGYGLAASFKSRDIAEQMMYGLPRKPNVYYGQSNCEVFSSVQRSKLAMLNEWSILQFQLQKSCAKLDPLTQSMMRIARKPVRSAAHAWATPPGASFRTAVDYYLSLILSGGLYVKWTTDNTYALSNGIRPFRLSRQSQKHMQVSSLPIYAFYPLFIVYFICIIFSCTVFVIELIFFYAYNKRKINSYRTNTNES